MILTLGVVILLGICAEGVVLKNDRQYCYSTDRTRPQILMFGGVTPYDKVRGDARISGKNVSQCKPSGIWYQGRHGARYPSKTDQDAILPTNTTINIDIVNNYDSHKTTLCPEDVELLKKWKINPEYLSPTAANLSAVGWDELNNLAERLQQAFPSLLPKYYSSKHYKLRHSPYLRTNQSAHAFAYGLFKEQAFNKVIYEGGQATDRYLYPFGNCPAWNTIATNAGLTGTFANTTYFQQMVEEVSEKLGFYGSKKLSASTVNQLLTHCRYEQLNDPTRSSAFCSAFSVANHQVNEYSTDLGYDTSCGYGDPTNRILVENMSCYLLKAMLQFLQSNDPSDQKAKLWFAHDANLQFMFVALGLFEDKPPISGSNFPQETQRKWKSSYLTPMGGNLVVVRFDCADGDNDILFLHNEKPLQIPGCKSNGVCKLSLILQRYSRFLKADCDAIFCTNQKY